MTCFEKLCEILSNEFQLETTDLTKDTTFSEIGLDSLQLIDVVMRIEEVFQVEISDEEMESFHSLSDVCEFLQR